MEQAGRSSSRSTPLRQANRVVQDETGSLPYSCITILVCARRGRVTVSGALRAGGYAGFVRVWESDLQRAGRRCRFLTGLGTWNASNAPFCSQNRAKPASAPRQGVAQVPRPAQNLHLQALQSRPGSQTRLGRGLTAYRLNPRSPYAASTNATTSCLLWTPSFS